MARTRFVVAGAVALVIVAVIALLTTRGCGGEELTGRAAVAEAPPSPVDVDRTATGERPRRHHLSEPEVESAADPVDGGAPVIGVVVDDRGEPVVGAVVRVCVLREDLDTTEDPFRTVAETHTDVAGAFSVTGLQPDTECRVEARAAGYMPGVGGVPAQAGGPEVRLKLHPLLEVRFQCVDEVTGLPVPHVKTQYRGPSTLGTRFTDWNDPWPADATERGLVRWRSARGGGPCTISVAAAGYEPVALAREVRRWGPDEPPELVRLRPSSDAWGELELHVKAPPGPSIEGARAFLSIQLGEGEPFSLMGGRTVRDSSLGTLRVPAGRVRLARVVVESGPWTERYETLSIRDLEVEVPAGGRVDAVLEIDESARQFRVDVRTVDESGRPLIDAFLRQERRDSVGGRFAGAAPLPARQTLWFGPGKVALLATCVGFEEVRREIEGRPGERLEITLAMRRKPD